MLENTDAGNPAGESASTSTTEKPKSIEETLRSGYKDAIARGIDEGGDDDAGEPSEAAEALKVDATGRVHGKGGKFAPKAGAAPAATATEAPAAPDATATATTATETQPPAAAKPHDAAPNTWKKEVSADWAKLPENVRQEIHRREADFHKGIGQYKDAAGFGSQMAQELLPYQETINKAGIHPREILKTLGGAWNTLVTGTPEAKRALLLQIAKDYSINIAASEPGTSQPPTDAPQEDPRLVAALQRIDKLEGHLTAQERQRAEAEFSDTVSKVEAFGQDPKHPHFNTLREDMAALIESGRATDLQDAYDKAQWINPEVRASLLAEQEKERVAKAAEQAKAARQAAGANVTRRGTPPVSAKPVSIEDTLRAGLRRLNGAG